MEERWREAGDLALGAAWLVMGWGDVMGPRNDEDTFTLVGGEIGFQLKTRHFHKDVSVNFQIPFGINL